MSERNSPKRITLADVARLAQVSVQTASHVLSGNTTVRLPEATRNRVREAAVQLGYQPNRYAQAMRGGRSHLVAIWMPIDRPVPVYLNFLQAFHRCARADGYDLMINGLDREQALVPDQPPPSQWPVDGIITLDSGSAAQAFRRLPANGHPPIVVIGLEEVTNGDCVSWDATAGAKAGVEHLIATGARRIWFVTPEWVFERFPREQRRRGYTEALLEAGLKPFIVAAPGENSGAARTALAAALDQRPAPDAIFAFSDTLAIGCARALVDRKLNIPNEVQVLGYGDSPEGADFVIPLSSLAVPLEEIARQAWAWLVERMDKNTPETRTLNLPMRVVLRQSTRPANG